MADPSVSASEQPPRGRGSSAFAEPALPGSFDFTRLVDEALYDDLIGRVRMSDVGLEVARVVELAVILIHEGEVTSEFIGFVEKTSQRL